MLTIYHARMTEHVFIVIRPLVHAIYNYKQLLDQENLVDMAIKTVRGYNLNQGIGIWTSHLKFKWEAGKCLIGERVDWVLGIG